MSDPVARPVNALDPEIEAKLDPEYLAFYNKHLANALGPHQVPWTPAIRDSPAVLGGADLLEVASTDDYPLSKSRVRVFTPKGTAPTSGWPVFIFYHGGGWTLGGIDAENAFCTRMCNHGRCLVVSVDYRLAPELMYPCAVEDAVESVRWVYANKENLPIDVTKIAVGGSSSGGNLAAIATHKATLEEPPIPLVFQLLIVPVTDNTALPDGKLYPSWSENARTAALTSEKMLWFRNNYLPNEEDWAKWDSSPIYAPHETTAKAPPAWIAVAELDILRDEGVAYGDKLKAAGVEVTTKVYSRAPHPIMAMDGVLEVGRQLVADAGQALAKAFSGV